MGTENSWVRGSSGQRKPEKGKEEGKRWENEGLDAEEWDQQLC